MPSSIARSRKKLIFWYAAPRRRAPSRIDASGEGQGEPCGVVGVCVNAGGDVSVRGHQADGVPWTVGLRDPRDPAVVLRVIEASAGHVATSGLYERGDHLTQVRGSGQDSPGGRGGGQGPVGRGPQDDGAAGVVGSSRMGPPGAGGTEDGPVVLSATVWGPDDGAADALATALFLDGRAGATWFTEVMTADTGSGREGSRWGAYVVEQGADGCTAWRMGAVDALAGTLAR